MYRALSEICSEAADKNISFWEVVLADDMNERLISREKSINDMKNMYDAMKDADSSYDGTRLSASGLVGTDGEKLKAARIRGEMLCGDLVGTAIEKAVKMGESNACMRRIVAAPTAGSCGVVPAVFITLQEKLGFDEQKMIEAMFVSGGIGGVIANRAFLAGAQGGCQAEIGAASAMAAGGAVYLMGGTNDMIIHASAMAMKNLLGLACDPVAGLVEVPCVKRNVIGAVNALAAADMAYAGVCSRIPPDEVIDAMRGIGICMPTAIKETGNGGLAVTPSGLKIQTELREANV